MEKTYIREDCIVLPNDLVEVYLEIRKELLASDAAVALRLSTGCHIEVSRPWEQANKTVGWGTSNMPPKKKLPFYHGKRRF